MRHSSCQRVRRTGSDPGRHRTAAQTRAINGCADASCQQLKVASIPPSQIASVNAVVAVEATCRRNYCADVDSVVNCPLRRGQLQRLQMRSAVRHSERSGTQRNASPGAPYAGTIATPDRPAPRSSPAASEPSPTRPADVGKQLRCIQNPQRVCSESLDEIQAYLPLRCPLERSGGKNVRWIECCLWQSILELARCKRKR